MNKLTFIGLGFLVLAGCAIVAGHSNKPMTVPQNDRDFAKTAVAITSMDMRSGGTGIILESRPAMTYILTNKHVCQLIQVGGKVTTESGKIYPVEEFRVYKKHDLCLITVFKDLGINIQVANHPPQLYQTSSVVGHPALLPTVITSGHFAQHRGIQLIVDMKPCDGTETGEEAMMCFFVGGKPVIKQFEAQLTSALIMPGSSGSGVYNSAGELEGVIFAGSEGLSYGFFVPWEYVHDFLTNRDKYPIEHPNPNKTPENYLSAYFKFQKICDDKVSYVMKLVNTCKAYANLGLYHE